MPGTMRRSTAPTGRPVARDETRPTVAPREHDAAQVNLDDSGGAAPMDVDSTSGAEENDAYSHESGSNPDENGLSSDSEGDMPRMRINFTNAMPIHVPPRLPQHRANDALRNPRFMAPRPVGPAQIRVLGESAVGLRTHYPNRTDLHFDPFMGMTPYHALSDGIDLDDIGLVALAISRGAMLLQPPRPHETNGDLMDPLVVVMKPNRLDALQLMVERAGPQLIVQIYENDKAWNVAGSVDAVRYLLERGAPIVPSTAEDDTMCPLFYCCLFNHGAIARLLLDYGADPKGGGGLFLQIAQVRGEKCDTANTLRFYEPVPQNARMVPFTSMAPAPLEE